MLHSTHVTHRSFWTCWIDPDVLFPVVVIIAWNPPTLQLLMVPCKQPQHTPRQAVTHHGSAILHHIEPNDAQEGPKAQLGEQRQKEFFSLLLVCVTYKSADEISGPDQTQPHIQLMSFTLKGL